MRKIFPALLTTILFLLAADCFYSEVKEINTNKDKTGQNITIRILPGPSWIHKKPYNSAPTFAIWIEDNGGGYIDTLYVSKKAATQGWVFAGGSRKEMSLPCWAHKRGVQYKDGLYLPTKENPLPDAVTSATPRDGFTINSKVDSMDGEIMIFAELNHSLDFNSDFPDKPGDPGYDKENGQPSIVYACKIDLARKGEYFMLPLGCGSLHGEDGAINKENLFRLTTALQIVDSIKVIIP
jgi:hypothetical protein